MSELSRIKNVIVGATISVYFHDDSKIATLKSHRLMEIMAERGQWTIPVQRTSQDGAIEKVSQLATDLGGELTPTGDDTFKLKVDKSHIKAAVAPAPAKNYIRLGKDAIFDNVDAAMAHVRNATKVAAPANIIVGLTKTFEKGSVEGQIKSVFGDVYAYGTGVEAVAQKVRDFKRITDADSRYDALRAAAKSGAAHTETDSVTSTFKYLFLIATALELPAKVEAPVEVPAAEPVAAVA